METNGIHLAPESAHTPTKRPRSHHRAGNLAALRRRLWRGVLRAERVMESDDEATCVKGIHALCQCAAAYTKLLELGELEERVQALEARATLATVGYGRNGR